LWQSLESLFNTQELVYQFHREKLDSPKPYNLKKLFEKGKKEAMIAGNCWGLISLTRLEGPANRSF
jgi:hypothetical protein